MLYIKHISHISCIITYYFKLHDIIILYIIVYMYCHIYFLFISMNESCKVVAKYGNILDSLQMLSCTDISLIANGNAKRQVGDNQWVSCPSDIQPKFHVQQPLTWHPTLQI